MFSNNKHKSVLTEKVFKFDKTFSVLFTLQSKWCIYPPNFDSYREYWEFVYKNGNSIALKHQIKYLIHTKSETLSAAN